MSLLYFFESIRNPVLDIIGAGITFFGSETFLFVLIALVFWCIDKQLGYRIAFSYIVASTANNIMKVLFRVPRPWVQDPDFTVVESVRDGATGFSFPSGHSNAIGVFGTTFFMNTKHTWIKIVSVALMVLVPISRMYVGVHTPLDVAVGLALGIVLTIIVNKVISGTSFDKTRLAPIAIAMVIFPLALIIVALSVYYNGLAEYENISDSVKSSGAFLGLIIGWYIERTKIDFNVRCNKWWKHVLKVVIGLAVIVGIRSGFKELFLLIAGDSFWPGDFIRYFLVAFFAIGIYPIFIKKFFSAKY